MLCNGSARPGPPGLLGNGLQVRIQRGFHRLPYRFVVLCCLVSASLLHIGVILSYLWKKSMIFGKFLPKNYVGLGQRRIVGDGFPVPKKREAKRLPYNL